MVSRPVSFSKSRDFKSFNGSLVALMWLPRYRSAFSDCYILCRMIESNYSGCCYWVTSLGELYVNSSKAYLPVAYYRLAGGSTVPASSFFFANSVAA